MPENTTQYNEELQKRMENLRKSLEKLNKKEEPIETEEVVQEEIEEVPEEEVKVSWLNRPRVRTHGWFTNLSTSGPVEIRNNGGEIN